MASFPEQMNEYRRQLQKGAIQQAYKGLMEYVMDLRTHFEARYPDCFVSGSIYYGYMDMTYFSYIPASLKDRKLKIAVVFNHVAFRFEVWLAAYNKQIQRIYWQLLKEGGWHKHPLVATTEGADAIVESVLVDDPNFGDLDGLTEKIESGTLSFARDVERFLSRQKKA